jgi:hypothetical protein
MLTHRRMMHLGFSVVSLAASGAAGVCCLIEYAWPAGEQGPDGPCSGSKAVICESGIKPSKENSEARKPMVARQAVCYEWTLTGSAVFVQALCNVPPAGGKLVGRLPNGSCCFVINSVGPVQPVEHPTTRWITPCEGLFCSS